MLASKLLAGVSLAASSLLVHAAPSGKQVIAPRQTCEFNSATNPECWGEYSLSTNWYQESPDTGVIREYWFDLVNTTLAPDGFERMVLTVNGTIPGPTIEADWGDTIVVHVRNSLQNNGTSIHWHGFRQNQTTAEDGVASITQCPVAPGDTITYRWHASQYGTTWYHSHFSLQAWNGVVGPIIVHGPASAPYDEDKGTVLLLDWHHQTTDALWSRALTGGPPAAENGLINGLNVYNDGGSRWETAFEAGKTYRLRLINGAIDSHFKFSIDNHTLTVISVDLIPVQPYTATSVDVAIGQRVDVVVTADQAAGDYWLRAIPQISCSATNEMTTNIRGIVRYDNSSTAEPTTMGWDYVDNCMDESMDKLVPVVPIDASPDALQREFEAGLQFTGAGHILWTVNNASFLSDWDSPTLQEVLTDSIVTTAERQIVQLDSANVWVYFIIQSQLGIPHPIHLHGHDFHVLAQEASATWSGDTSGLRFTNPPRRDTAMLPAGGYLVLGFVTDNPGTWLLHCHIGWHTSGGLAFQVIERQAEIAATVDADVINDTCTNWNAYAQAAGLVQEDSGI